MKTGVVDGGIHRVGKRTRDVGRARGTVLSLAGTDLDSLNAIVMKTEQLEYAGNWSQLFLFRSNPMQSVGSMFHSFMSGSMCAESRGRMGFGPKIDLTQKQALNIQLHSLQVNNTPYADHGVEVMYRFASFDPFERSKYFGRNLDLGQFERFKRIFFTPLFAPMLGHAEATLLSELPISNYKWRGRIKVLHGVKGEEEAVYDITMVKDEQGVHKDMWMTTSLVRDGADDIPSFL